MVWPPSPRHARTEVVRGRRIPTRKANASVRFIRELQSADCGYEEESGVTGRRKNARRLRVSRAPRGALHAGDQEGRGSRMAASSRHRLIKKNFRILRSPSNASAACSPFKRGDLDITQADGGLPTTHTSWRHSVDAAPRCRRAVLFAAGIVRGINGERLAVIRFPISSLGSRRGVRGEVARKIMAESTTASCPNARRGGGGPSRTASCENVLRQRD